MRPTVREPARETPVIDEADVVVLGGGPAGIAAAVAAARMGADTLLIVDVDMPHLNGLEFVRWMRADPNTRKVPVIFMTAFERFQPEATALGADCLLKPLVEKALVELVGRRF